MLRLIYSLLFTLLLPFALLRLLWRSRQDVGYRQHWRQRLGALVIPQPKNVIWFHAVSLGETVAVAPLVERVLQEFPEHQILVTHMTLTGYRQVEKQFGERVFHQYLPYDLPFLIGPFLRRLTPKLLIIVETELWPNLLQQCRRYSIPVMLANGRMNSRSAKRYSRFSAISLPMLQSVTKVAVQTERDYQQFKLLGLTDSSLAVCGNLKYDQVIPDALVQQGKQLADQWRRLIWVAASTHPGEDEVVLKVHKQLLKQYPNLLLVLVPRHPERFDSVAELIGQNKLSFVRHSDNQYPTDQQQVWLGDTLGQMFLYYALSDIALVAGSLKPIGGHNPIEPAALGKPVLMGPEVFKCRDLHDQLVDAGALLPVTVESLYQQLQMLLDDPKKKSEMGQRALSWVEANRGAVDRQFSVLCSLLAH